MGVEYCNNLGSFVWMQSRWPSTVIANGDLFLSMCSALIIYAMDFTFVSATIVEIAKQSRRSQPV